MIKYYTKLLYSSINGQIYTNINVIAYFNKQCRATRKKASEF